MVLPPLFAVVGVWFVSLRTKLNDTLYRENSMTFGLRLLWFFTFELFGESVPAANVDRVNPGNEMRSL
jgi:hypothetical protein